MRDEFLDFGQLRTFLRVVDEKGVVHAARSLDISQPSVTQQIRRLEQKLGKQLFSRRGNRLALTNDGEALVIFARSLFELESHVRGHFSQRKFEGSLRIGLNEDLARTALPGVLDMFSRAHPECHLDVRSSFNGRRLFEQIDEGRLDVVVARQVAGRSRSKVVGTQDMCWLGSRDHRGSIKKPIQLVVPSPPSETRDVVLRTLDAANLGWQVRFESANITSLEAAVKVGVGVSACIGAMQSDEIRILGVEADLPPLPPVVFALERRPDADGLLGLEAFEALLQRVIPLLTPRS